MVRCWIWCVAVYFLSIPLGQSAEVKAFTYFLSGRDGAGHTVFDRFELYPNGKALWQVAGKGGICPNEGGHFQGQFNDQEKKNILLFAQAIFEREKKQKSDPVEEGDSTRKARHLLQVEFADAVYPLEIKNSGPEATKFFEELAFLKAKVTPQSAIRMVAVAELKGKQKNIKISFKNIGVAPFRLIFPKNPDEVFFLKNGTSLVYQEVPKKRDLVLQQDKSVELVLTSSGVMKGPLYFDSGVMAHHGLKGLQKNLPEAMEVYLCAGDSL